MTLQKTTQIDISTARKQLARLVNVSYMQGESFILTKRNIPVAKIVPLEPEDTMHTTQTIQLDTELFGILKNDARFPQEKTSADIAKSLRDGSWRGEE